ncbi:MAG TPA: hypothetical protein VII12_14690 [Thermoanaerobaculia bacterium]
MFDTSTPPRRAAPKRGLAIVSQIVKLHGGTVLAESPGLGQGSTFIVTLPLLLTGGKSGRRSLRSRQNRQSSTVAPRQN